MGKGAVADANNLDINNRAIQHLVWSNSNTQVTEGENDLQKMGGNKIHKVNTYVIDQQQQLQGKNMAQSHNKHSKLDPIHVKDQSMENTEEYAFSSGTKQQSYLEGFSTNNSALIGVGSAGESGQESTDKNLYRNQGQLITGEYVCQDLYIQDVASISQN